MFCGMLRAIGFPFCDQETHKSGVAEWIICGLPTTFGSCGTAWQIQLSQLGMKHPQKHRLPANESTPPHLFSIFSGRWKPCGNVTHSWGGRWYDLPSAGCFRSSWGSSAREWRVCFVLGCSQRQHLVCCDQKTNGKNALSLGQAKKTSGGTSGAPKWQKSAVVSPSSHLFWF